MKYLFTIILTVAVTISYSQESMTSTASTCSPLTIVKQSFIIHSDQQFASKGWIQDPAFSDEFNSNQLDLTKWRIWDDYCDSLNGYTIFHNSPDNVYVDGTALNLKASKLPLTSVCKGRPYNYTSGWIESLYKIQYGFIEARIYIPTEHSFDPCFWTMGAIWTKPTIWDTYDEIDIFERSHISKNDDTIVLHNCYHDLELITVSKLVAEDHIKESYSGKWYTIAVEWLPEEVHFYMDGEVRQSYRYTTNNEWIGYNSEYNCNDFDNQVGQRIQFSMAGNKYINDLADFSETMKVYYVHSYKLQQGFNYEYYPLTFDPNDSNLFKVHKSIHLGGPGHTAVVDPGINMTIWATDSLTLDAGFIVNAGARFAARVIKTQPALFQLFTNGASQN